MDANGLELGEDRFFGGGANDSEARPSRDKIEQGGDGFDVVTNTQVEAVIGIDFDYSGLSFKVPRQFFQDTIEDLAGSAPRGPKRYQHRFFGLQDLCAEVRLRDVRSHWAIFARVHHFASNQLHPAPCTACARWRE